jgi:uncharacterized peroxidase-related enzyme
MILLNFQLSIKNMPHIKLEDHLFGITGLLEYRQDTAAPLRELTQILLRGESSLTAGERELIATLVSARNKCVFCTSSHAAAADLLVGDTTTCALVTQDFENAPVSDKLKALLNIAALVQQNGQLVTTTDANRAKNAGATDREIHDTVMIAALFSFYNRYVDGLGTTQPIDSEFYGKLGERLLNNGYYRLPNGYDHLKNNPLMSKENNV